MVSQENVTGPIGSEGSPLAQQFAQVREFVDGGKRHHKWTYDYDKRGVGTARCADDCPACASLAALSAIERHVQDMETALRQIADGTEPGETWAFARAALSVSRTSGAPTAKSAAPKGAGE